MASSNYPPPRSMDPLYHSQSFGSRPLCNLSDCGAGAALQAANQYYSPASASPVERV